jgi:hypothetical protein
VVSRNRLFNQLYLNIGEVTDNVKGKRKENGGHTDIGELLSALAFMLAPASFLAGNDKGKGKARTYELNDDDGQPSELLSLSVF